jgi:hypothetical protein
MLNNSGLDKMGVNWFNVSPLVWPSPSTGIVLDRQNSPQIQVMRGAHDGYDVVGRRHFVGIYDDGRLGILRFGHRCTYIFFHGIYGDGLGSHKELLFVVNGNHHGLLRFGIALGFGYAQFHYIGVGQGGDDEEKQQQYE